LNILKIPHKIVSINLLKSEQNSDFFMRTINPLGTVPAMVDTNGNTIWQSLAIIDYLDPKGTLLPNDPLGRARCMQIVNTICSEIQPLQNLSVISRVSEIAGGGETGEITKRQWAMYHNKSKLAIIEKHLIDDSFTYIADNKVTLADICLIPQLYSARRFGLDINKEFPGLMRVVGRLEKLDAFQAAHAHAQPDCPHDIRKEGVLF